jgi:opacity protein-like surface antigen
MRRHLSTTLLLTLLAGGSLATAGPSDKPVSWQFDFGYSMQQGAAGDFFDDGYTIGWGAVVRPDPAKPIGYRFEMSYDWWDANTGNLPDYGVTVDDGDATQWRISAGIQFESKGDSAKFIGGVGIGGYRLHADLTNTVVVPGWVCDPYWYWYCYPGWVEGDVILADKTLTKFGYYATAGVSFPLTNSEIYVEAQYHWVNVEQYFETFPIVIGWRF